jgi:drug/metabolite transporter (DMT)-like permease
MIGVALALLASFTFSLNAVLARRGLAKASASAGAFVTVLIGVPMFVFASLVTGQLFRAGELRAEAFLYLSVAGIIHFGVGRYCNYRAVSAIGATRTGPVQAFTIPYAILIAFIFLDEAINLAMGFGIALVLTGPAIMVQRRSTSAPAPVPSSDVGPPQGASDTELVPVFQLRQAEGYTFAILSVGAYGTSPILIRAALEGSTDLAIFGATVAYTAAAGALVVTLVHPARRGLITAMRPSTVRLFLGAGFFAFLAQMSRFIALSLIPVAVVTPLQRSGTIFTLFLSWAINRHLEVINLRVVAGILVSVVGAVVLVVFRETT